MENNNPENNFNQCPIPAQCFDACREQTQSSASIARTDECIHPRFVLTPESMGINVRPYTSTSNREQCVQQIKREQTLVDVKPYCERHHTKQSVGSLPGSLPEPNSSQSHTQRNLSESPRTESNRGQRLYSLNNSYPESQPYSSAKSGKTQRSASLNISTENQTQQKNVNNTPRQEISRQQETSSRSQSISTSAIPYPGQPNQPSEASAKLSPSNKSFAPSASSTPLKSKKTSDPNMTGDLTSSPANDSHQCAHLLNSTFQKMTSVSEIQTSCCEQQLQFKRSASDVCLGDAAKTNFGLINEIFVKRLQNIEENAWGDKDLKLMAYQEWVDVLFKMNKSFINNMEELEKEVTDRLKLAQGKINTSCRNSQGNELMKCRKDIATLLKLIQNAYHHQNWDLDGLTFETITLDHVFGVAGFEGNGGPIKDYNDAESMQTNKDQLLANMKALAYEVAEKHDEVRELKRQVICLEDEIQKAHKKIQLKDNVIKELRNDLKCANNKLLVNTSLEGSLDMPPINFENQTSRSANTQITECNTPTFHDEAESLYDFLSYTENEEQQALKVLEDELKQFFELNQECNKQNIENQRKKLTALYQRLESEKADAYRKLDYLRRRLVDLESSTGDSINDCDSGFHSKSENDKDNKILDSVRKRLQKLKETNCQIKKRVQELERDNNQLSTSLQSEKAFSQCNSNILKQIADLLSDMRGEQFSYAEMYNAGPTQSNPFCEAIIEIRKCFKEQEAQLEMKNKQISNLFHNLIKNKHDFYEEKTCLNLNNLEDIKKTTSLPLSATSSTTSTPTPTLPVSPPTPTLFYSLAGQKQDNTTEPSLHSLINN